MYPLSDELGLGRCSGAVSLVDRRIRNIFRRLPVRDFRNIVPHLHEPEGQRTEITIKYFQLWLLECSLPSDPCDRDQRIQSFAWGRCS